MTHPSCYVNKMRNIISEDLNDALSIFLREELLKCFSQGLIAIDFETTGLSPLTDKIVEFAAVKLRPNGSTEVYNTLVNPEVPIPKRTTDIHGIEDNMVKNSPAIENLLNPFLDFAGALPIVGHNVKFDFGLLSSNFYRFNIPFPSSQIYCSLKASRKAFERMPNHRLDTLVNQLNIPLGNHHHGLNDAFASMIIFAKAVEKKKSVLKTSFLFNGQDLNRNTSFYLPNSMKCLVEKLSSQEVVEIKYEGGSYKGRFRPLKLIGLFPLPEGSTLYAQCLLTGEFKNFLIKRIRTIKELTSREQEEKLINLEKCNVL